jgi:hypothetical protein
MATKPKTQEQTQANTPTIEEITNGDEFYSQNFPPKMEKGQTTNEETRTNYYNNLLVAGKKILMDYFQGAIDVSGKGLSAYKTDHPYRKAFKPKNFKNSGAYSRIWQAVKLASQDYYLLQVQTGNRPLITEDEYKALKIIDQWKLIDLPNDEKKLEKIKAIVGMDADERGKKGKVAEIASAWTARELIKAITDKRYDSLKDINMIKSVVDIATENEQTMITGAIDIAIKEMKAIIKTLGFIRPD